MRQQSDVQSLDDNKIIHAIMCTSQHNKTDLEIPPINDQNLDSKYLSYRRYIVCQRREKNIILEQEMASTNLEG